MKKKPYSSTNVSTQGAPRTFNDCLTVELSRPAPEHLFDSFWFERDIALLFGPPGIGKSVMATQIADLVARGRCIPGLRMSSKRRKVLYVDLVLSEAQLRGRYSGPTGTDGEIGYYHFSQNLRRARPGPRQKFSKWLREQIVKDGWQAIVIDDVSALRTTSDGTRELVLAMRDLKALRDEFGVSILVIAGSRQPRTGHSVCENDLGRAQILCEIADSVFAMTEDPQSPGWQRFVHMRSRSGPIEWCPHRSPQCRLTRGDGTFLSFEFDRRFEEKMDEKKRELICRIRAMWNEGLPYRVIGERLGISKSQASKLCKQWTQEIDPVPAPVVVSRVLPAPKDSPPTAAREEPAVTQSVSMDEDDYDDDATRYWFLDKDGDLIEDEDDDIEPPMEPPEAKTMRDVMIAAGCTPWIDGHGKEVYVEKFDERGKPIVKYTIPSRGRISHWVYGTYGWSGRPCDGPVCWRGG